MKGEQNMKENILANLLYISLALCLVAQIIIGGNYIAGQGLYLVANLIGVYRTFTMKRRTPDKVKDSCFLAVTLGLIILYFLKR
jgi:hypothetical protein